jgi:hypothetical protein
MGSFLRTGGVGRELFKEKLSAIYDDIEAGIPLTGDLAGCYKIKIVFYLAGDSQL